jgi:hypothetical protein
MKAKLPATYVDAGDGERVAGVQKILDRQST